MRTVGDRRIIDRIADALDGVVDETILIANAPDAGRWLKGARVVSDASDRRGSLVGLRTALDAAAGNDVLVVAWDMPFVTRDLLAYIASKLTAPILAAVPALPDGLQPFCAAYAAKCLALVDSQIAKGELRMSSLVGELPVVRRIGINELSRFGRSECLFFNVNTTDDLAAAEQMAREN